jgi:2-iminobutanoate/2-iminopropanoate deaminase
MVNKTHIATNAAPPALGTHSQAIRTGDLVFVTGQIGRDPETGKLEEGLEAQTRRMLSNIEAVLNASGCSPEDIVKTTLLMADIKDFKAVDMIYATWLPEGITPRPGRGITALPARTAYAVAGLPAGALVMLEVVAAVPREGGMITAKAPRAFNREIFYDHPENVYYGTDDGYQDGSFAEIVRLKAHYDGVDPRRREDIHMISVVGGLYGLNLIPLWRPRRLTFFDVNPPALTYFQIIRRVWTTSRDNAQFLARLTDGDYEVDGELEEFIRENIRMKQRGYLPPSRGSSNRSYELSWKYALEHFDLTKKILSEAPLHIRCEPMESDGFSEWIRAQDNVWIYSSNITQFHYFDLEFSSPANVVAVQIINTCVLDPSREPEILDLSTLGGGPAKVKFEIPLRAERLDT